MIRLIRRRLIIPRGDTGTFTIPVQGTTKDGDIAVFSLYDPLTRKVVLELTDILEDSAKEINITFSRDNTVNLIPKKYFWDIKMYYEPTQYKTKEGEIIDKEDIVDMEDIQDKEYIPVNAATIDSYYAAFSLPVCEIREVTQDVP